MKSTGKDISGTFGVQFRVQAYVKSVNFNRFMKRLKCVSKAP